jgi:hypothetical protein
VNTVLIEENQEGDRSARRFGQQLVPRSHVPQAGAHATRSLLPHSLHSPMSWKEYKKHREEQRRCISRTQKDIEAVHGLLYMLYTTYTTYIA